MSVGEELTKSGTTFKLRIHLKHWSRCCTLSEQIGRDESMLRLRNATKICVTVITLLLVVSSIPNTVNAQSSELDPLLIMYDASHSPQFAADNEEEGLKLMLDMINESTRYKVRINYAFLNTTILNDVDVLIIASPDASAEFNSEEILAIDDMLTNGSSLLLMGDPSIDQNSTYWSNQQFRDIGENWAINRILTSLNISGPSFSFNETLSGDETVYRGEAMFDYEHAVNSTSPSIIQFDATTWDETHPIFRDINSIIAMTATLKPIGLSSSIATGYDTSFAQYRRGPNTFGNLTYPNMTLAEFEEHPRSYSAINGTFPSWLSAFEYDNSRIILTGSTIMFSGKYLDIEDSEEQWFYQADNSRLFMNMLSWLTEGFVESPDATIPIAIISSVILVLGIAIYLFKKMR